MLYCISLLEETKSCFVLGLWISPGHQTVGHVYHTISPCILPTLVQSNLNTRGYFPSSLQFFGNTQSWQYWHFCITFNVNKFETVANQILFTTNLTLARELESIYITISYLFSNLSSMKMSTLCNSIKKLYCSSLTRITAQAIFARLFLVNTWQHTCSVLDL